jgi:hypothetical protein
VVLESDPSKQNILEAEKPKQRVRVPRMEHQGKNRVVIVSRLQVGMTRKEKYAFTRLKTALGAALK